MLAANSLFSSLNSKPETRLCSKASSLTALSGLRQPGPSPPLLRQAARSRTATRVAASASQPLLRVVGRIAARTLPAWAAAARGLSNARVSPVLVVGLVAYSVAVTIWATRNTRSQQTAAVATVTAAPAAPPAVSDRSPSTQSSQVKSLQQPAAVPATPPPAAAGSKDDGRVVCQVCNGSGQVSLDHHMEDFKEGTICPCCLGKGRVKKNRKGGLFELLLQFDP